MTYQYLLAKSRAGLNVHLRRADTSTSLCGRQVEGWPVVPFALNGCKRCASVARKDGTDFVIDLDGERVDLTTWVPFAGW